jgi:hypothetical protein
MPSAAYAEDHKLAFYADCRYTECHHAECRGAKLFHWQNVALLDVIWHNRPLSGINTGDHVVSFVLIACDCDLNKNRKKS